MQNKIDDTIVNKIAQMQTDLMAHAKLIDQIKRLDILVIKTKLD